MEISLGDFVLSGGEIPCLAFIDGITRLLPNVLGNSESSLEESFENNLLEYPQYTRPADFNGWKVPEVLLNGNHKEIALWRKKQAEAITQKRRPDIL
jgi:tRNA (guanine37-N1)-methyltransferase